MCQWAVIKNKGGDKLPCYNPRYLVACRRGKDESTFHQEYMALTGRNRAEKKSYLIEKSYYDQYKDGVFKATDFFQVPCGKCIGCKMEYAKQWALRCDAEMRESTTTQCLTITYDDKHVPMNEDGIKTLDKTHLTKFMKKVRRYYQYRGNQEHIRFYGCGEYGSTTLRPHYHIVIFNLESQLETRKYLRTNENGTPIYLSPLLTEIWAMGEVTVSEANWQTISYIARYVTKKAGNDLSKYYESMKVIPEFTRMSRRPGIGMKWLKDHRMELYKHDEIWTIQGEEVRKSTPPRALEKWIRDKGDENDNELLDNIKRKRKINIRYAEEEFNKRSQISRDDYNKMLERLATKRANSLIREL